jgi:hypothetical protein
MGAVVTAFVLSFILKNTTLVNRLISYSVIAAAWLGIFAFLSLLAGLFRPWALGDAADLYNSSESFRKAIGKGAGVWMGFISALFIAGIFTFLAVRRPPELPVTPDPNSFVRKWLLFVSVVGSAVFIGLVVFLSHIV